MPLFLKKTENIPVNEIEVDTTAQTPDVEASLNQIMESFEEIKDDPNLIQDCKKYQLYETTGETLESEADMGFLKLIRPTENSVLFWNLLDFLDVNAEMDLMILKTE